jgi:hypothetical protein
MFDKYRFKPPHAIISMTKLWAVCPMAVRAITFSLIALRTPPHPLFSYRSRMGYLFLILKTIF